MSISRDEIVEAARVARRKCKRSRPCKAAVSSVRRWLESESASRKLTGGEVSQIVGIVLSDCQKERYEGPKAGCRHGVGLVVYELKKLRPGLMGRKRR